MAGKIVISSGTAIDALLLNNIVREPFPDKSVGNITRSHGISPLPKIDDVAVTNSLQAILKLTPSRYFDDHEMVVGVPEIVVVAFE